MKPLTQATLGPGTAEGREAYDRAFALAYRYFRGGDLVEEMVASKYWVLGRNRPAMRIEMVSLPLFGDGVGVLFPYFDVKRVEDMTADEYVTSVEEGAHDILGELSDKEYLARRAIGGTMPHLNHVFEELGMHHVEHKVPVKVLKSIEDKAKKAATKNNTTAAESKKRRGIGVAKAVSKK